MVAWALALAPSHRYCRSPERERSFVAFCCFSLLLSAASLVIMPLAPHPVLDSGFYGPSLHEDALRGVILFVEGNPCNPPAAGSQPSWTQRLALQ